MIKTCRLFLIDGPQFQTQDGITLTFAIDGQPAPGPEPPEQENRLLPLLRLLADAPLSMTDILQGLKMKDRKNLKERYIGPALEAGLIEPTIPDKPKSPAQKYRLTPKGSARL